VVKEGHKQVGCDGEEIQGRCDSFPLQTDVHYPTDMNLLLDALPVVITTTACLCEQLEDSSFRKSKYLCRDKGIKGFKRYVALAIVSRNIQRLGTILQKQEIDRQKRREKVQATWAEKANKLPLMKAS